MNTSGFSPFTLSETWWRAIILVLSGAVLIITVWCLTHGITIVFMHLYYFPIVLLAYRYRWKGFWLATLLALAYLALVIVLDTGQPDVMYGAFYRFLVFVGIAAVIAYLSKRLAGTQESLKDNQRFQESVIANANVWISVLAPDGTILVWNDAAEIISGYKKAGVLGKNTIWIQLYPDQQYRRKITAEIRQIITRDMFLENFETRIQCADGMKKTIIWNTRGMRDDSGRITSYIAIGRDITGQREAESRAGVSAHFLSTMIDTLPVAIFFKDANGKYLGCNPPFEEYIGIKKSDLIGKTAYDISPRDLADRYTAADRQVMDNPAPQRYETQVQYADGSRHDVIFYKAPYLNEDGKVGGLIGTFLDISERKKAEQELRKSEEKYRTLFESMSEGFAYCRMIYDTDGLSTDFIYLTVNPAFDRIIGVPTVTGKPVTEVFPGIRDAYPALFETYGRVARTAVPETFELEFKPVGKWLHISVYSPAKEYFVAIFEDITDRKHTEEQLRKNQLLLASAMDLAQMVNWEFDITTGMFTFDDRFYAFYGTTAEQEGGHRISAETYTREFVYPDDIPSVVAEVKKSLTLTDPHYSGRMEHRIVRRDGAVRTIIVRFAPVMGSDGKITGTRGANQDITERKQAEERREQIRWWQDGVNRILASVLAPLPLDEKLNLVTNGVVETFGADFCRIWLIDKGDLCSTGCMHADLHEGPHVCLHRDTCLHLRASSGRYTHIDGKAHGRVPYGAYKIGRIASGDDSKFLTNDVQHDPNVHDHAWAKDLGLVGFAGYQLKPLSGNVLGVFALFTGFPISDDMDALLELLSRSISMIIQKDAADRAFVEIEQQNRESRQLFSDIISFLPDATFVIDKDGKVLAWNRALETLSGVPAEDMIGRGNFEYSIWEHGKRRPILIDLVLHPDQDAARMDFVNTHYEGSMVMAEMDLTLPSGRTMALSCVASPLVDSNGRITGAIESIRDISRVRAAEADLARLNANLEKIVRERTQALRDEVTQRVQAEQNVKSALDYTQSIIQANPDLMVVLDTDGTVLDVNTTGEVLTGIPREKLIGTSYFRYLVDDGTHAESFARLLTTGKLENQIRVIRDDGHITPVSVNATVIQGKPGTGNRIIVSAHDITRQQQDEAAIRASLEEKVILLREIHHRVKNNLQIIISLTNLQMRKTHDPVVKQIVAETQNRVRAMSLVHEKLYRSESLSQIDFADYTRYLTTQLFSYYMNDTRTVKLDFSLGKIMVDINTAVPLGLIMNELVSNALKHGFPNGRDGTIRISGGLDGDIITLVVADDGVGIPAELDWKNTDSLGMRLITSLVDQIGGTLALTPGSGTQFTITVRKKPTEKDPS